MDENRSGDTDEAKDEDGITVHERCSLICVVMCQDLKNVSNLGDVKDFFWVIEFQPSTTLLNVKVRITDCRTVVSQSFGMCTGNISQLTFSSSDSFAENVKDGYVTPFFFCSVIIL